MRAINSGNEYHIYDNSVKLYNGLPPQIYGINFNPHAGIFSVSPSGYRRERKGIWCA